MTKKDREEHFSEKEALVFHTQGKPGKIEIKATKPLETQRDLSLAYSPGVAAPVNAIAEVISTVYDYTSKGNIVAVISNGTAILGLILQFHLISLQLYSPYLYSRKLYL